MGMPKNDIKSKLLSRTGTFYGLLVDLSWSSNGLVMVVVLLGFSWTLYRLVMEFKMTCNGSNTIRLIMDTLWTCHVVSLD